MPNQRAGGGDAAVSASEANRSLAPSRAAARQALLTRLASQPASGEPRTWRREELYD